MHWVVSLYLKLEIRVLVNKITLCIINRRIEEVKRIKEETINKYTIGKTMFEEGKTLTEIGETLNISRGRFAEWLRSQGVETKRDHLVVYEIGKSMYLDKGISLTKIAEELRVSRKWFTEWLKEQGIEVTNPSRIYTYNEEYFECVDTEDKAYWLGFLYADGGISERYLGEKLKNMQLELTLQQRDEDHLRKFLFCLDSNVPIKHKNIKLNQYNKIYKASRVMIGSTKICRDLIKLGCTPRKSSTLKFPSEDIVPSFLTKHFVRGYIDGDGYIGISTNKRRARLEVDGNYNFLKEMQKKMNWSKTKLKKRNGNNHYSIQYSSNETLNYLTELYESASIYLDRKYHTYKELIRLLR